MFDPTSRYFAIPEAVHAAPGGVLLVYKRRRLLPQPAPLPTDRSVVARAGERLDTIAARMLGDPRQFWRIADAGNAMNPFDLAEPGTRLVVPTIGFGTGTS